MNGIASAASQLKTLSQNNNMKPLSAEDKQKQESELRKACSGFEGMFLEMMMKSMRTASGESSSFIKKSNGEKIFTEMLDQQYVDIATKSGANGIGEVLFQHLKSTLPQFQGEGNNFPPSGEELAKMQQLRNKSLTADTVVNNLKGY